MLLLALTAGAAQTSIQCTTVPCFGTDDNDRIFERKGNDRIRIDDGDGQDFVNCGKGNNDVAIITATEPAGTART